MILGLIIGIWVIGYFITFFLSMLIDRLNGLDPETVYNIDDEDPDWVIAMILLWPLVLIFCIFYILWKCLKKLMIAIIETIVAIRDT